MSEFISTNNHNNNKEKQYDAIIIGSGIAGLTTALELAKQGKQVLIIDAQDESKVGGLARSAFGGMALIGTPEQKPKRMKATMGLAIKLS